MTLQVDFFTDWIQTLHAALANLGFPPDSKATDEQVEKRYFNLQKRLIPSACRTVHEASDIVCPLDRQAGYDALKVRISSGQDLKPHLSKFIKNLDRDDAMLNDWGIHHLHLGIAIQKDGFVDRSGPLLFARFTKSDAYLIAIGEHGDWSDQDLIRTLQAQWPETVRGVRMKGFSEVTNNPTDEEIAMLRENGINTVLQVADGVVVFPLGGGVTLDRTSVDVVRTADFFRKRIRQFEKYLREKEAEIRAGQTLPDPLMLNLIVEANGNAYAVGGNLRIALGSLIAVP